MGNSLSGLGHGDILREFEAMFPNHVGATYCKRITPDDMVKYYSLNDEHACLLLQVLSRRTACTRLRVMDIHRPASSEQTTRFEQLFATLGSMPSVESANLYVEPGRKGSMLVLPFLVHITSLDLIYQHDVSIDADDAQVISSALQNHTSLRQIFIKLPMNSCPQILPTLHSIQRLTLLELGFAAHIDELPCMDACHALADLLRNARPELVVGIFGLILSDQDASRIVNEGIAESSMKEVFFKQCNLGTGIETANAITSSQIKKVNLNWLLVSSPGLDLHAVLPILVENLPRMPELEGLKFGPSFYRYALDDKYINAAATTILQAASMCPRLVTLEVEVRGVTNEIDEALAKCLADKTRLTYIRITHGDGTCHSTVCAVCAVCASPKLLTAMCSNYTLTFFDASSSCGKDMWDLHFTSIAECITRLNSEGRAYMTNDMYDRLKGLEVLAGVRDSLDCLYFHLRENPYLVTGQRVPVSTSAKRRPGLPADSESPI